MTGFLFVCGALYFYLGLHIVISIVALTASGHGVGRVLFGVPAFRVATVRGTDIALGPFPLLALVTPRQTETQITKARPEIWDDAAAREAATELASRSQKPVLPAFLAGLGTVVFTFVLGAVLAGGVPPLGRFLTAVLTKPWWPWSSGASALVQGFTELSAQSPAVAFGGVLVRVTSLIAVSTVFALFERIDKLAGLVRVVQTCVGVWGLGWFVALPFALLRL